MYSDGKTNSWFYLATALIVIGSHRGEAGGYLPNRHMIRHMLISGIIAQ